MAAEARHPATGLNGPIKEAWKEDNENYGNEEPKRYLDTERFDFPTPYYGFDHVDMVTAHGDNAAVITSNGLRSTDKLSVSI